MSSRTSSQILAAGPFTFRAELAAERFRDFQDRLIEGDLIAALRTADSFAAMFTDLLGDISQAAYNDGHTKAEIARALGVSPSTFRGMVAT